MRSEEVKMSEDISGLTVEGTVVFGDWEGDPSIPRGVNYLAPYVRDVYVETPDGEDITGWLTNIALSDLADKLVERCISYQ